MRGVAQFSEDYFMSRSTENFRRGTLVFQKIFGMEKITDEGGGAITFFRRNFLTHSAQKIRRGTLRCFIDSRVSKNFMHKGGELLRFSVGKFLVQFYRKTPEGTFLCLKKFRVSTIFLHE